MPELFFGPGFGAEGQAQPVFGLGAFDQCPRGEPQRPLCSARSIVVRLHATGAAASASVVRLTGKRPSAIRYYEQVGLLPHPARMDGRRRHDHGIVRTLAVIDTGQRLGLTLEEIRTLLAASPDDGEAVGRLRDVAVRKLPQISSLIERGQLVRDWLECAARCECPHLDQCPLFDDPAIPAPRQPSTPTPGQPGPRPTS